MPVSRELRFRTLFTHILGSLGPLASFSGAALLLPACSSSIDAEDFASNVCGDELAGVTPTVPVDYLEIRSDFGGSAEITPTDPPRTVASRGAACLTAKDRATCLNTLASLRPTGLQSPKAIDHFDGRYLVFTRGDDVGAVITRDALVTFLAPFENARDGALMLQEFTEHRLSCDGANARATDNGFEFRTETGYACGAGTHRDAHVVAISTAGVITVIESERLEDGDKNCAIGRRPEGYVPIPRGQSIGDYLATAAELEAASVPAFQRLARELRAHGAPDELVRRALNAARDEIRHARTMRKLAKRFGGSPKMPRVGKLPIRPLVDIAIENAQEGCIRETFGALVGSFQAMHARDPEIRSAMTTIAHDETQHAALAWDVSAWLESQLDDDTRRAARNARGEALASLRHALTSSKQAKVAMVECATTSTETNAAMVLVELSSPRRLLGLPSGTEELELLEKLAVALFDAHSDVLAA